MQQVFEEILKQKASQEPMENAMHTFIEASAEADMLLQKLLHSQRREQVEKIFVNAVRFYLQKIFAYQEFNLNLPLGDAKVMPDFCTYEIVGLLLENCGRKTLDKEKLAKQLQCLTSERMEVLTQK